MQAIEDITRLEGDFQAMRELYPDVFTAVPHITWNNRLTNCAGRCWTHPRQGHHCSKIELSTKFLCTNGYDILLETLLHECAHAIVNKRHNASMQHRTEFRAVCDEIGCKNKACTYDYAAPAARLTAAVKNYIRRY